MKKAFLNPWVIGICLMLSIPLAGFGCGVVICSDCGGSPVNYLLMGAVHAVLSTLAPGRCWTSSASSTSLWPYIPVLAVALWASIGSIRLWVIKRK